RFGVTRLAPYLTETAASEGEAADRCERAQSCVAHRRILTHPLRTTARGWSPLLPTHRSTACAISGNMDGVRRLLLTSAGVRNETIYDALVDLLGRPIEDCTALCIPTAMYGHPHAGPGENVWEFVAGRSEQPMIDLGWKSVGLIELTALPSIDEDRWIPLIRKADALLVSA